MTVQRGELNDVLILHAEHLKPNTGFDMFTVQNSNLLADGSADPNFKNFGLAWYQSDLESDANGKADVTIKTILLDQIFGFDPAVGLNPVNTFQIGFWFNNPDDAAACGFDTNHPTPFNGEHRAGPAAMISLPNARHQLRPALHRAGANQCEWAVRLPSLTRPRVVGRTYDFQGRTRRLPWFRGEELQIQASKAEEL